MKINFNASFIRQLNFDVFNDNLYEGMIQNTNHIQLPELIERNKSEKM